MPEFLYETPENLIESNSHRLKLFLYDPALVTTTDGVKNYAVAGISSANITTATLSIKNYADSAVIASGINVLTYFNTAGNFSYLLPAAYQAIISTETDLQYEDHIAIITVVCSVGTETHTIIRNIRLRVLNQKFTS